MSLLEAVQYWAVGGDPVPNPVPFYELEIGLIQYRIKNSTWFGLDGGAESAVVVRQDGVALIPHTVINGDITDIQFVSSVVIYRP